MMREYVALDIETTGLSRKKDRILEIGAVKMKNGMQTGQYAALVNPGMSLSAFITELTGIDDAMVRRSGREIREVMTEFLDFCQDAVIVGHKIAFDHGFLTQNAVNIGRTFPDRAIDTLETARKCLPELPSRKLDDLCVHYGIEHKEKHRAFADAQATAALYEKLAAAFGGEDARIFYPKKLVCRVKRDGPITNSQKVYLNDLMKYHKIELNVSFDTLTRSQASRMADQIILQYGRMTKR